MKKIIFALMIMAVLACPAMAARYRQHQVTIVDEFGDPVTNIDQIEIFDAGTATTSTIYSTRAGTSRTNPMTTTSGGFDQSLGLVSWFQAAPDYKITVTESGADKTLTIDNRAEGDTRFPWYANYIAALASLNVGDDEDLTFGDGTDVTATWENTNSILSWIPDVDGVSFDIGDTDAAKQFVFHVYVGGIGGGGLTIDEGTGAFTYVSASGDIALDATGSGAFGVHTSTATGAITLGSSTSGAFAVDGASTASISVDGDITVDSTAGSIIIEGQEDIANAVLITADGGTNTTMKLHNDTGTGAASIYVLSDVGGITATTSAAGKDILVNSVLGSIRLLGEEDVADAILIEADGGTNTTLKIWNDTGTGAASIYALSDVGGITLTTSAAGKDILVNSVLGNVYVLGEEDAADAVQIEADGGTNTTLKVFNDTGTGATSIYLLSDVGGITQTCSAGAMVFNATGGATGDWTATIGDEYILDVEGGIAIDSAEAAQDAIGFVASAGGGGITFTAGTLGITCSGDILKNYVHEVEIEAGSAETVLAADSGKVFATTPGTGTVTYTLPGAAAGLVFTFIDGSATALDNIKITAVGNDTINSGTAAASYGTAANQTNSVTLVAIDAGSWEIVAEQGTFVAL